MRSHAFAGEALLTNSGINFIWQNTQAWRIKKIRVKLAFSCIMPNQSPPTSSLGVQVFANLWLSSGSPPRFSSDAYQQYDGPPPDTWASNIANAQMLPNPAVTVKFGGAAVPGCLWTTIQKTLSTVPYSEESILDGLDLLAPQASVFVFHMDAQGPPCDVEIGGNIFYQIAYG